MYVEERWCCKEVKVNEYRTEKFLEDDNCARYSKSSDIHTVNLAFKRNHVECFADDDTHSPFVWKS